MSLTLNMTLRGYSINDIYRANTSQHYWNTSERDFLNLEKKRICMNRTLVLLRIVSPIRGCLDTRIHLLYGWHELIHPHPGNGYSIAAKAEVIRITLCVSWSYKQGDVTFPSADTLILIIPVTDWTGRRLHSRLRCWWSIICALWAYEDPFPV